MQESASIEVMERPIIEVRQPRKSRTNSKKPRLYNRNDLTSSLQADLEDKEPDKLSYPQRLFCNEYVRTKGNGTKSALSAYHCSSDGSAASTASSLLKLPKIQREIAKISDAATSSSVTPELITRGIAEIAINEKTRNGDRLKGFELLARLKGLLIDRVEQRQTVIDKSIDLSALSTPQLLAALQARLRLSASGIRETVKAEIEAPSADTGLAAVEEGHYVDVSTGAQSSAESTNHAAAPSVPSQYTDSNTIDSIDPNALAPQAGESPARPSIDASIEQGQGTHTDQAKDTEGGGGMPLPGPVGE